MNILRVIAGTNASEGGPIEGIRQITKLLALRGHTTEVASLDPEDASWLNELPFKVYPLGTGCDRYVNAPRLRKWLVENARNYDVVIQHGLWNPTGFATWRAMRTTKSPYLVYTHGMLDPWFRKAYPLKHLIKQLVWLAIDGRLTGDAKYVLFTTEEERLLARKSFWPRRYREKVVKYGTGDVGFAGLAVLAEIFRQRFPDLGEKPFLLFLSRIHPKKGCDLLIQAFAAVAQRRSDLHLVIAGPDESGIKPHLVDLAAKLGVGNRIHWPGMLEGDAKWGAFAGCEAFVLPSHQENFGIAVAEAMACGRPILITNKVNIWREVLNCGGGIVANDDLSGVTHLLEAFLKISQGERTEMGHKARAGFLQSFEISNAADTLLSILEEVAGKRSRGFRS
jgi:glycosyltransferase involved in cell wall biosynthesis